MKKYILILLIGVLSTTLDVSAHVVCPQRLDPKEFNRQQQEFITEEAKLTQNEAKAFFVVYFELQDKKRINNQEIWKLMRFAKEDLTESQYESTLSRIFELRKSNAELDIKYFSLFKNIIPNKKIFSVLKAESKFQRQIIKGMHHRQKGRKNLRNTK